MKGTVEQRAKGRMLVAFDTRYAPLYITTFQGAVDMATAEWQAQLAHRVFSDALRSGLPVISVTDSRTLDLPSAELRKFWAEQTLKHQSNMERMLGTLVIIDSPILRGVLALMTQLFSSAKKVEYVPSLGTAVQLANSRLMAKGWSPVNLEAGNYRLPPLAETSARL